MHSKRIAVLIVGLAVLTVAGAGVVAGLNTDDPAAASHDSHAQLSQQTIAVDATGTAEAAPDAAVLDLAVTAEGDNQSAVRDELAASAADLRAELDDLGVEYETTRYSVERSPRFEERDLPPYRGVIGYTVRLDDPDRAGTVADAAVDAGAAVGSIDLTLSEETRESLRDRAIENALDDARSQAGTIADATDLTVAGTLTVDATQQDYSPVSFDAALTERQAGDASTQIDAGDVSVTYDVQVTYLAAGDIGASGAAGESTSASGSANASGSGSNTGYGSGDG